VLDLWCGEAGDRSHSSDRGDLSGASRGEMLAQGRVVCGRMDRERDVEEILKQDQDFFLAVR
jgi:hypothetical protein